MDTGSALVKDAKCKSIPALRALHTNLTHLKWNEELTHRATCALRECSSL